MSTPPLGPSARPRRLRVARIILLLLTAWAGVDLLTPGASAQDQVEPSGYRQAIHDALSEYESERYPEALTLFRRAHELYPNARTLRGLGVVNFELRRYSDSVGYLESALASDERSLGPELRSETERLLVRARAFVAELRVVVEPPTALVAVDGGEPRDLPLEPLLLSVGAHQFEFQAPGYEPSLRAHTVVGGEQLSWKVRLRSSSAPSGGVAPSGTDARLGRWQRALGGSAIVLGAAAFAGCAVLAVQRRQDGEHLSATDVRLSSYPVLLTDWKNARVAPYALAASGAVAASSGALGLLLAAPRESFPAWAEVATATVGVGLAAWGTVDIIGGGPCDVEPELAGTCVLDQHRRDRGALVMLAAAPFLSVSVTQLVRRAFAPTKVDVSVALVPHLSSSETSATLGARVRWL